MFDLLDLRPFQNLHVIPTAPAPGVNVLAGLNVHSIAIQVPIADLTGGRRPKDVLDPASTVGVWTTASRRTSRVYDTHDDTLPRARPLASGVAARQPARQRGADPDGPQGRLERPSTARWTSTSCSTSNGPRSPGCCPCSTRACSLTSRGSTADRADLVAVLLTGLPKGVVPGFQNFTGPTVADVLRLNVAVQPSSSPNPLGLVGGDPAGFPNGRRVGDDVVTVELRAIAGATYPLVAPTYTPGRGGVAHQGRDDAALDVRRLSVPRDAARRLQPGRVMHAHEPHNASAGQGPVMVDVDAHTGALVLVALPQMAGAEIEISPAGPDGAPGPRQHVAVLARRVGTEVVHAAVYPSLPAGRWQLWSPQDGGPVLAVDVPGGRVVEARWPVAEGALASA